MRKSESSNNLKNAFYKDIDSLRLKSSCSLWMVILTLLLIFLSLFIILVFGASFHAWQLPTVKEKIDSANLVSEQIFPIAVTKEDVVSLSEQRLEEMLDVKSDSFPLQNASLKISPEGVKISGRKSKNILSLRLEVITSPEVQNGQLKLNIKEIKAAGISAPKSVVDTINPKLVEALPPLQVASEGVSAKKIELFPGYLEVTLVPGQ
jgi:uncharacterized protein YpmS